MKKYFALLFCVLAFAACKDEGTDTPQQKSNDVSINATLNGVEWVKGDAIALTSSCSRGENSGVAMSANPVARLVAAKDGATSPFLAASEGDKVLSEEGDRSFKFYAAYPYKEGLTDLKAVEMAAAAVQTYSPDPKANFPMVAGASVLNVLAPVALNFKSPYCLVTFKFPKDIIQGQKNTLKKITFASDSVKLAESGSYNVITDAYTPKVTTDSTVTVEFGEGLLLDQSKTDISVVFAPFSVPENGIKMTVETTTGSVTLDIFTTEPGKEFVAGTATSWILSNKGDSVDPITFPVTFLLGKDKEGNPQFTQDLQPRWKTPEASEGRWLSTQPTAFAQWHWGPRFEGETIRPIIEIVNNGAISSPGVKGIWSGDYLEFNLPVKNFAAGTTLRMTFPFYGRQHPMFWDLEYFDGSEWKCNRSNLTSNLPAKDESGTHSEMAGQLIPCECTFVSNLGSNLITHDMTFANAIADGYVIIRLKSVHAEYQNGGASNKTDWDFIRSTPWVSDEKYGAPFYFYCADIAETEDVNEAQLNLVIDYAK